MSPADHKGRMPTSIKIDEELWKQAKIEAINRNIDLSELVEEAVRKEIGKESKLQGGRLKGGRL